MSPAPTPSPSAQSLRTSLRCRWGFDSLSDIGTRLGTVTGPSCQSEYSHRQQYVNQEFFQSVHGYLVVAFATFQTAWVRPARYQLACAMSIGGSSGVGAGSTGSGALHCCARWMSSWA